MTADLRDRIIEELGSHGFCHVATVDGDRPLNSTVEYANDGTTLFFVSIPGTQKVANLERNPRVAIAVSGHWKAKGGIRGVQLFGTARLITDEEENDAVRTRFLGKFLFDPTPHWSRGRTLFYEVSPERIDLIDYSAGFGSKETWTP